MYSGSMKSSWFPSPAAAMDSGHGSGVIFGDFGLTAARCELEFADVKAADFGAARLPKCDSGSDGRREIRAGTRTIPGIPSRIPQGPSGAQKVTCTPAFSPPPVSRDQMLCGKLPIESTFIAKLVFKNAEARPADNFMINRNVMPRTFAILDRATGKDPDLRIRCGREITVAVRATARGRERSTADSAAGGIDILL